MLDLQTASHPRPVSVRRSRERLLQLKIHAGFPYSKRLRGHTSCVNALAFSPGGGRWLASAGDDPYVLLWDFCQDNVQQPSRRFCGHKANVFALAFSASSQYLYSGDTDNTILMYDMSRLSASGTSLPEKPTLTYYEHGDSIRAISCHPTQDEIFLSASEDGRIILHDTRADSRYTRAQRTVQQDAEFTGVQIHPTMPHFFVTSDYQGRLCLRDMRMAFGPSSQRRQNGTVQAYVTTLSKTSVSHLSNPEVSSVTFDNTGTKLTATMLHHLPTIYSLSDPIPVAMCSKARRVEGTYSNSCTIKHGSFGSGGLHDDRYYCAGSDDFSAYMWEIPEISDLVERRQEISSDTWSGLGNDNIVGFASSPDEPRHVPVNLDTPMYRLTGHESIVNTALMHPHLQYVVTSGIERDVVLHSPTAISPSAEDMSLTPKEVRPVAPASSRSSRLLMRALGILPDADEDADDDQETIALFDEIRRQEGDGDIFDLRDWSGPEEDSFAHAAMDIDQ